MRLIIRTERAPSTHPHPPTHTHPHPHPLSIIPHHISSISTPNPTITLTHPHILSPTLPHSPSDLETHRDCQDPSTTNGSLVLLTGLSPSIIILNPSSLQSDQKKLSIIQILLSIHPHPHTHTPTSTSTPSENENENWLRRSTTRASSSSYWNWQEFRTTNHPAPSTTDLQSNEPPTSSS